MTGALFCDQCGARLPTSSAKFCPSCGEALEPPSGAPPNGTADVGRLGDSVADEESDLADVSHASHERVSRSGHTAESVPQSAAEAGPPVSVSDGSMRTSRNVFAYLAVIVIAVLCVGFYFTPHIAVNSMKAAAEARDTVKFSQYIDYPALRESLKSGLAAKLVGQTQGRNADPFAALGASMAAAFIDPVIDKLMSPEGLAMLMAGGEEPSAKRNKKAPGLKAEIDMAMAYESFNKFVITIWEKNKSNDAIRLIFNRDGFFSWKLAAIRM